MLEGQAPNQLQPAFGLHQSYAGRVDVPHSVLIFPIWRQSLVWVKHPLRGWEVPGGKVEHGETPEQAVNREAFEEAGLLLRNLLWIAEYQFMASDDVKVKWVYTANVVEMKSRPPNSEIVAVEVFNSDLTPQRAIGCEDVSPVMKDVVFSSLWPMVEAKMTAGSVDS